MKALSEAEAALADTLQQTISYHLPVLDITYARAFALELIECRNRPSMWTGTTTKVEISALEDVQRTLHRSERQLIGLPRDLRDSLEDRLRAFLPNGGHKDVADWQSALVHVLTEIAVATHSIGEEIKDAKT